MCGIAGFSGRFDAILLTKMTAQIKHRGPDDEGTFYLADQGVGLAHTRLSIIDLSPLGHQPMHSTTADVTLVFNGEIYNYRELRSELIKKGFVFRGHSDTEVILNLYLALGDKCFSALNGIFALALWDARTQKLLLVRDGQGIKPLYYAETPDGIVFASEIKSILQCKSVSRTLDAQAIQATLSMLWTPGPSTVLENVKKLPPGYIYEVCNGQIRQHKRFYQLPCSNGDDSISSSEAISRVKAAVELAVKRQLVADVPVGAFLSGGLDSSAVVAMAKQQLGQENLDCFTIRMEGGTDAGNTDDLPYAERVAKHLGVRLHTVSIGPEMAHDLEKMVWQLDEPQADPAPLNVLYISRFAREHGIKVMLSGAGGDDIFTGYRRHWALMQERYWAWLPKPARDGLARLASVLPNGHPMLRRISKALAVANREGADRISSYFLWLNETSTNDLLSGDMRAKLTGQKPHQALIDSLSSLSKSIHPLRQMLHLEQQFFLADHNLNYTDKMSMAAGVETRVPLLDPDLIALADSLPIRLKQQSREGKWVFKKAMEGVLPHDVIYRPKSGFGAPVRRWIQHDLKDMVEETLSITSLKQRGIYDPVAVKRLIADDQAGKIDGSYSILALMCMELWCRQFVDKAVPGYDSLR